MMKFYFITKSTYIIVLAPNLRKAKRIYNRHFNSYDMIRDYMPKKNSLKLVHVLIYEPFSFKKQLLVRIKENIVLQIYKTEEDTWKYDYYKLDNEIRWLNGGSVTDSSKSIYYIFNKISDLQTCDYTLLPNDYLLNYG